MAIARETPPHPVIAKSGSYTVLITPPYSQISNPNPNCSPIPKKEALLTSSTTFLPSIQAHPQQFQTPSNVRSSSSLLGFFWEAVAKVQDVNSRLGGYLADWFGLNQSKYQWALDDYYQSNTMEREAVKGKNLLVKS